MEKLIIGGLVLALLISLYWSYRQNKNLVPIHLTDRNIAQVRGDFQKLRLLVKEWNVFKGIKEIKELVEQMESNPLLEKN